jgi:hypothetical protein
MVNGQSFAFSVLFKRALFSKHLRTGVFLFIGLEYGVVEWLNTYSFLRDFRFALR